MDSKVSIHLCIYEYRADANLQNIADNITNKSNSKINYILGKTVIYDISPKTNIVLSSTVKRKKSPAVATLELKTLFSTEFHVYSLVLCFRAQIAFQMKNLGWWRCICVCRGEPRAEKYQGVTRGAFLWSDNQVRRQLF